MNRVRASFQCLRHLLATLVWALAAGCSLHPVADLPAERLSALPPRQELTATPFVSQADYQCGPASLSMVFGFYGQSLSPAQLVPWVFTPDARGSFPAEMDAVSRRFGFASYPVDSLADLLTEVAAGHPVLVLQNLATDWYPRWHFAVVVGFDRERQELVLRSGDQPRWLIRFDLFETTWIRSDHWGRVLLPPDRLPATATPERWLQAAADLEQTGPADAALSAFRTAVARWPDQPLARFGLASRLLAAGKTAAARTEFEHLLQRQPRLSSAWNNYAYALHAAGCPASARTALDCALRLAPDDPNLADSRRELASSQADASACTPLPACPSP